MKRAGDLRHLSDDELSEAVRAGGETITELKKDAVTHVLARDESRRWGDPSKHYDPADQARARTARDRLGLYSPEDDAESPRLLRTWMRVRGMQDARLLFKDASPLTLWELNLRRTAGGDIERMV